jgi:cyanophycinase
MNRKPQGKLMIIGGAEKGDEDSAIFAVVAKEVSKHKGHLLIVTVATDEPDGMAKEYRGIFKRLGIQDTAVLDIRIREDAYAEANVKKCTGAAAIYFTGGDQLRITSQMGDSPVYQAMVECYLAGAMIVGTSAGAAAMPEVMIISDPAMSPTAFRPCRWHLAWG